MSSTETRIPLEQALALAAQVEDMLRDSTMRLETAGSIRRGRPDVGDLELVAIARVGETSIGLFGDQVETIDTVSTSLSSFTMMVEHLLAGRREHI